MAAHPVLRDAFEPVPVRGRAAGHPPDRDPRARVRHRPRADRRSSPPGGSNSSARSTSTSRPPTGSGWSGSSPGSTPTPRAAAAPRRSSIRPPTPSPAPSATRPPDAAWRSLAAQSTDDAPWLAGLNRLSDPSSLSRFVVSRTLYRRVGRYAWWLLVPFAVAALLRVAVTPWVLGHLGSGLPARASATPTRPTRWTRSWWPPWWPWSSWPCWPWSSACSAAACGRSSGGGALDAVRSEAGANDAARDAGRRLVGRGYAGLITAATFQSELTHLGVGFYANVGATGEVVEERRARLGLPPVFLQKQWVSWVELETGRRAPRAPPAGQQRAPLAQPPRAAGHPGRHRRRPAPVAGGVLPHRGVVAGRPRPEQGPPPHPPGPTVGIGAPSSSPASSTCSTPSRRRCGAGSTSCCSSCPSGPAWPPGP